MLRNRPYEQRISSFHLQIVARSLGVRIRSTFEAHTPAFEVVQAESLHEKFPYTFVGDGLIPVRGTYGNGTCPAGADEQERRRLADELMADGKNRAEHDYVVRHVREVFRRVCFDVDVPQTPGIMPLTHVQHLHTPAAAQVLDGVSLWELMGDLHPTPAVSGTPVGEARMLIRRIERYNRGFFAGACGYIDAAGDGEFSVGLRTGVFDGETGWLYAGCGIVAGSDADAEYDEIGLKLKTILDAFEA